MLFRNLVSKVREVIMHEVQRLGKMVSEKTENCLFWEGYVMAYSSSMGNQGS
jgi:hypothetical protein